MAAIFFFLLGLGFSQIMARAIYDSLPGGRVKSWCLSVLVQYVICVILLVTIDKAPIGQSLSTGIALTSVVRMFYLFKDLKHD
jgi:hypothetical protein